MTDYNYHTHTYRCGHATGTEREYIENAIALGMNVIGFSDHLIFEDKDKEKFDDYIQTIKKLKEEYKGKIEIYLGFECEYLPERDSYFKYLLENKIVDYLILGQHYVGYKGKIFWDREFGKIGDNTKFANVYYKHLKMAMKSGYFSYIAHPDLFIKCFDQITPKYLRFAKKICKLAKKYEIPLEINLNGIKNHYNIRHFLSPTFYPNAEFFEIAGKIKNDIVIGIDAHETEFWQIATDYIKYAEDLIQKYNLHHISRIKFKNIEK